MSSKLLASALERLELLKRREAFDPAHLDSMPTAAQQEFFSDFGKYKQYWIRAGNQCKPATSLVLMADGSYKKISEIEAGDWVAAFDYAKQTNVPARVTKLWKNGVKPVFRYWFKENEYTDSTPNHQMVYHSGPSSGFGKRPIGGARELLITPAVTSGTTSGTVPHNGLELLGFLLGDGCLTKLSGSSYQGIQFTALRPEIVEHVRRLLPEGYHLRDCKNGDYFISQSNGKGKNIYINWIRELGLAGTRSGTKFIPDVVFTSPIEDRYKFIAGMIATDGYVTDRARGFCSISERMARDYLRLLRTIGLNGTLSRGTRTNPNHADLWSVEIKSSKYRLRFDENVQVVSKSPKGIYSPRALKNNYTWSSAKIRKVEYLGEMEVFDITIDHPDHVYICDGIATSNSGKSQCCSRLLTSILLEDHPLVAKRRNEDWGSEPLLALVAGRTGKQIEDSLLPKLRSYLPAGSYKEVRQGNAIQRIELSNGNRIVFQSLENPNVARERLMSYVAHITWVDELPPTLDLIREVLVRTQARDGYALFSFTPTVVNVAVQKFVDSVSQPEGKMYKFRMLDNPLYSDPERKTQLLGRYAHMPDHIKRAVFEGDWITGDDMVFQFDYGSMVEMPPEYSPLWRHVESVDPAISSATGITLWAENPGTGIWYCILAEYLKGVYVPTEIVNAIQYFTKSVNVVRRISDYAPWYVNTASSMGISYMTVESKNANRKPELIKGLQQHLGTRMRIAPHCDKFIDEIQECRWSDKGEGRVVNHSSFHILDSAQYAADVLPPPEKKVKSFTLDEYYVNLLQANEKRKALEERAINKLEAKTQRRPTRLRRGSMWK
jgi:hypothetical protein